MSEFEANSCYSVNLKIRLIVTIIIGYLYCTSTDCQHCARARIQFNAHARLSAMPIRVLIAWDLDLGMRHIAYRVSN